MDFKELHKQLVALEESLWIHLNKDGKLGKDESLNELWEADSLITQAYDIVEKHIKGETK